MKKLLLVSLLLLSLTAIKAQDPLLGEIKMFAGNFAPRGWALCDGQLLSISQNTALFSILGTIYGGDGRTTFALPDLRGRVAMHPGNGAGLTPRSLGQKGGAETNTLSVAQLPSHTHAATATLPVNDDEASSDDPTGKYLAVSGENMYSETSNVEAASPSISVANTGSNQSVNNVQPYATVNYIIALQGIFPSRN